MELLVGQKPTAPRLLVLITVHDKSTNTRIEWSCDILNRLNTGEFKSESRNAADHLYSPLLYTSDKDHILLYSTTAPDPLSMLTDTLNGVDFGISTTWRLYEPLPTTVDSSASPLKPPLAAPPFESPHILVLNGMTPVPEREDDFNKWYSEEHIPMLSRVPGWIYSKRYRLLTSGAGAPRYLAIHAWESDRSFDSAPYKLAVSTPWRMAVVNNVEIRDRHVAEFVEVLKVAS